MKLENEDVDFKPICPHCEKEIDELILFNNPKNMEFESMGSWAGVAACPECHKIVPFGTHSWAKAAVPKY